MEKLERIISRIVDVMGKITSFLLLLMVLNVSFDVMMRYLFHDSSVGMQEMEWHLFAVIFLFGISVALKDEGHVRVDFLYDNFSPRKKAVINILGTFFFLMPLALLIFFGSFEYVKDAFITHEIAKQLSHQLEKKVDRLINHEGSGRLIYRTVVMIMQVPVVLLYTLSLGQQLH